MLVACLLFSIMNICVYAISYLDNSTSVTVISFIRILFNLLILIIPAFISKKIITLWGDGRASLWWRGLFGGIALMLSFASISRIGPGESTFLNASNGVFIALLCPLFLGQKYTWQGWIAILGSFFGVALIFAPKVQNYDILGCSMALGSGFFAALAYLMVARAGRSNSPSSVIFYFCIVSILLHFIYFGIFGFSFSNQPFIWLLLSITGILGSGAQFFMTRAYQTAPAALVSATGYLQPLLSLVWDMTIFNQVPNQLAFVGCLLILIFGACLPFLR